MAEIESQAKKLNREFANLTTNIAPDKIKEKNEENLRKLGQTLGFA
jgi:hypothetical protein